MRRDSKDFDVIVIKTDGRGKGFRLRRFGGRCVDTGYSVQETHDGGYIVVGTAGYLGGPIPQGALEEFVYLIKIDGEGNEVWRQTFDGEHSYGGHAVQQTWDLGYIVAGTTRPSCTIAANDAYLIKTDEEGNELWSRTYGGERDEIPWSAHQTRDGGV